MELTTFFISRPQQIYAKTLTISENAFKMKVMSAWTLFELLLTSGLTCKQRLLQETRLCNIFRDTNTKTLIKAISESPNKLLQRS